MVDPTSRDSDAEWLEALRADVRSLAVAEALSDVPDPGNGSVVTWVKRERGATPKRKRYLCSLADSSIA